MRIVNAYIKVVELKDKGISYGYSPRLCQGSFCIPITNENKELCIFEDYECAYTYGEFFLPKTCTTETN